MFAGGTIFISKGSICAVGRISTRAIVWGIGCLLMIQAGQFAAAAPSEDSDEEKIRGLAGLVSDNPYNVDVRLQLASRLSWKNRRKEARHHATEVVKQAPKYWDAHILIARIDAWDGLYARANSRIEHVLKKQPDNVEAWIVAANIGLWSRNETRARRALNRLLKLAPSADIYYKHAQVSAQRNRMREAKGWAAKALKLDPEHQPSKRLQESVRIARVDYVIELERFPIDDPDQSLGLGGTLTATLFPGEWMSYTAIYQYQRRFGTNNNRLALRADYRMTPKLTLTAMMRVGVAEVVPQFTAFAQANYRVTKQHDVGLRYTGDKLAWPGSLHRMRFVSGVQLPFLRLEGAYEIGVMTSCGTNRFIQGAELKGLVPVGSFVITGKFGFGMELERPPLPAFIEGRFGSDICIDDEVLDEFPTAQPVRLVDTRAHSASLELKWNWSKTMSFRGGYGIQRRFSGNNVHLGYLGIQKSF